MVFTAEEQIENTVCQYHKLLYTENIPLNIYQELKEQSVTVAREVGGCELT